MSTLYRQLSTMSSFQHQAGVTAVAHRWPIQHSSSANVSKCHAPCQLSAKMHSSRRQHKRWVRAAARAAAVLCTILCSKRNSSLLRSFIVACCSTALRAGVLHCPQCAAQQREGTCLHAQHSTAHVSRQSLQEAGVRDKHTIALGNNQALVFALAGLCARLCFVKVQFQQACCT
jgi:hypothetical protein